MEADRNSYRRNRRKMKNTKKLLKQVLDTML